MGLSTTRSPNWSEAKDEQKLVAEILEARVWKCCLFGYSLPLVNLLRLDLYPNTFDLLHLK